MGDAHGAYDLSVLSYRERVVYDLKGFSLGRRKGTLVCQGLLSGPESLYYGTFLGIHGRVDGEKILSDGLLFRKRRELLVELMHVDDIRIGVHYENAVHVVFHIGYYVQIIF